MENVQISIETAEELSSFIMKGREIEEMQLKIKAARQEMLETRKSLIVRLLRDSVPDNNRIAIEFNGAIGTLEVIDGEELHLEFYEKSLSL